LIAQILDIPNAAFNIHSLPPLIAGLAIVALGLYAFIRERVSFLGASFFIVCASIGIFYFSAGMNYAHQNPEAALFWTRFGHLGVIFIPCGILLLNAARFGLNRKERYILTGSGILTTVFYFNLFFTNLYVMRIDRYSWGHYAQFGPLGILFILFFVSAMAYVLRRERHEFRHGASARSRLRSRWLFVAFCGGSLGGLDFLAALGIPVYPLGHIPILFFSIMGAYILARYRLKDITPEIAVDRILETMQGAVIVTDPAGIIRVVNPAARTMLEYEQAELLNRDFPSLGLVPDEVSAAVRSGEPVVTRELTWQSRGGKLHHVTVAVTAVRDTLDNMLAGMVYLINDITTRKQYEEKLSQSEQFIRRILDTVDQGFIIVDRDYRIQIANRAYREQLPVPCDNIVGKYCYEVSHGNTLACYKEGHVCAVQRVFEEGIPHTTLHKHAGPGDSMPYLETKAYPVKDGSGEVTSAIVVISDITERHLLEQERLKTQKLEAVGTLAGGIAHDFNNLLQGIFGYIALAKMSKDEPEKCIASLEEAEKAISLSVQLTKQLLTFSKGGKPVKKAAALPPLIERAARFALSGSRSSYHMTHEDDLWKIDADEGQISQVIQNIVINADQAMPAAGCIEITARNVRIPGPGLPQALQHGPYVEVSIADSGIGIPEKHIGKIFDPYFTTKAKGSGLGLATSYSIIRNHNGAIHVESAEGKRTVFRMYLPAVTAAAAAALPVPGAAGTGRRANVLVMDDETAVLNVAGAILKALGHDVQLARHGAEALEKYEDALGSGKPFNVVIIDLTIRGGMGGVDTMKRLLELDPQVKAIVSSGYSEDSVMANYEQHGFKAALMKPYDMHALKEKLHLVLSE
jgi:two-component system, cell cycle sensor histidine kinase and response regulator CckA